MSDKLITLTEHAYIPQQSVEAWVDEVVPAIAAALGRCAFVIKTKLSLSPQLDPLSMQVSTFPEQLSAPYQRIITAAADPTIPGSFANHQAGRQISLTQPSVYLTETFTIEGDVLDFWETYAYPAGVVGAATIQHGGLDERWLLTFSLSDRLGWSGEEQEQWEYFTAHMGAGLRLQKALDERSGDAPWEEGSSAVMTPEGRLLEVFDEGLKENAAVQEAVREAARSMDRARGSMRRTAPLEALALWRGLADGEFSLVDRFDTDGKRFVLLQRNAPQTIPHKRLSHRERQVLTAAATGLSNKMIAYELGLAHSSVSTLLSRAMTKLGASSRLHLIELAHHLLRNGDGDDDA